EHAQWGAAPVHFKNGRIKTRLIVEAYFVLFGVYACDASLLEWASGKRTIFLSEEKKWQPLK
ncbi:MAG TPA: hypothetical protein VF932_03140, partial [Anaerolineae bacterium]